MHIYHGASDVSARFTGHRYLAEFSRSILLYNNSEEGSHDIEA